MSYVLVITAPDGTETRKPLMYGPQIVGVVAGFLKDNAPRLPERERTLAGMGVMRAAKGITYFHQPTGYRFRVEEADTAGLTLLSAVPAQAGA